jgi:hypothetical protein
VVVGAVVVVVLVVVVVGVVVVVVLDVVVVVLDVVVVVGAVVVVVEVDVVVEVSQWLTTRVDPPWPDVPPVALADTNWAPASVVTSNCTAPLPCCITVTGDAGVGWEVLVKL